MTTTQTLPQTLPQATPLIFSDLPAPLATLWTELTTPIDRLAHPWLLLLALTAPLWMLLARRPSPPVMFSLTDLAVTVPRTLRQRLLWLPAFARIAAIALLAFAAARPQRLLDRSESLTDAVAIQLVIDRSSSMSAPMRTSLGVATRLEIVKEVVDQFLADQLDANPDGTSATDANGTASNTLTPSNANPRGDLIGLIQFAQFADTVCPLVQDPDAVRAALRTVEMVRSRSSDDGTAIGRALELAGARLEQIQHELAERATDPPASATTATPPPPVKIRSRVIVLLTDGYNTAGDHPSLVLPQIKEWGIKVYTIGIVGASAFERAGTDVAGLEQIARETGGRFFAATDADTLREVYAEIDRLETTEVKVREITWYEELFAPYAALALVMLIVEQALRATWLRRLP